MNKYISKRLDVQHLLKLLNKALQAEFYAAITYFITASLCVGHERQSIHDKLMIHYKEELEHAELIKERIKELGGIPYVEECYLSSLNFKDYMGSLDFL